MACINQSVVDIIKAKVANKRSRRLKILIALKCILETITKANGYTESVKNVSFNVSSWKDIPDRETPTIFIVDDMTEIVRRAGKTREYTWAVKLYGVYKEANIEEFEEFIADVEECIEDNNNLVGVVSKTEINQVLTDNQYFSEKTCTHLFEIELQMEYIRCHKDPR